MSEETIEIYSDGASRGNPGPAALGAVLLSADGTELATVSETSGISTNNVAEYKALIEGMRLALSLGYKKAKVKADSELMIKQINKIYKVKNENIKPLYKELEELKNQFTEISFTHVRREANKRADQLANLALDQ